MTRLSWLVGMAPLRLIVYHHCGLTLLTYRTEGAEFPRDERTDTTDTQIEEGDLLLFHTLQRGRSDQNTAIIVK